jgi:antiviral helicase SKI2
MLVLDFLTWLELDWYKSLKDMSLHILLNGRSKVATIAQDCKCIHCLDFPKHFATMHDQWIIKEKIDCIRHLMSNQNLQLLPDYKHLISVLKDLGFIDENSYMELKGKVACEIHSADELVLTELVLKNRLSKYEPEEILALLSCFIFQEKTDSTPNIMPARERSRETISQISERVNYYQT